LLDLNATINIARILDKPSMLAIVDVAMKVKAALVQ
jgi:hypothetical protein